MTASKPPAGPAKAPSVRLIGKQEAEAHSADLVLDNIAQLKALFPEAFSEGRVDFDVLKSLLGAAVDEREEKYGLNWHGKRRARQLALTPSTGTLRPCPEESVDWETTQNLMIEGDNLEVLKLLQKSYAGKVKLIYIDPPYNTGKDFVYPDNFQDSIKNYLELTGQVEGGKKISSNTDASGRFHTDWLNMMYPRIKLARQLLKDDGLLFVSIDDAEHSHLRSLCDDVFGEENFIASFVWEKRTNRENRKMVSSRHDYIVCYAKEISSRSDLIKMLPMSEEALARYRNPDSDPRGPWKSDPATAQAGHGTKSQFYVLTAPNGSRHELSSGRCWVYTEDVMNQAVGEGRLWFGQDGNGVPRLKTYLEAKDRGLTPESIWFAEDTSTNEGAKNSLKELFNGASVFDTPKPIELVRRMLQVGTDSDSLVVDFFAGSGTTGHAVFAQNASDGGTRRFILVQLPEPLSPEVGEQRAAADHCDAHSKPRTLAEITKERIRLAAKQVVADVPTWVGDLGFRAFRLDTSNIRAWNPNPEDLQTTVEEHTEHLLPARSGQDVLYELLLKLGLDLTVPIETRQIAGKTVHNIGAGSLIACLSDGIDRDVAEPLALGIAQWQKAQSDALQAGGDEKLKPVGTRLVFKDSAFADDVAKTNLAAILSQHGLDDVRSI